MIMPAEIIVRKMTATRSSPEHYLSAKVDGLKPMRVRDTSSKQVISTKSTFDRTSMQGSNSTSLFEFRHLPLRKTNQKYLDQIFQRIKSFSQLKPNWNSYDAAVPNQTAINGALEVLELAHAAGMLPDYVNPSAEDGIALSFVRGTRFTDIECFNSGEILAGMHDRDPDQIDKRPIIWTIRDKNEIVAALNTIRAFIYG